MNKFIHINKTSQDDVIMMSFRVGTVCFDSLVVYCRSAIILPDILSVAIVKA